jgi:hypothetical protein
MAIDPRIALGVKSLELPTPTNNLAQYAQMQQIQSGQAEQQINALKMQEYERTRAEEEGVRNYLSGADLTKPETQAGLLQFGKTGIAYGKALTEADTAASARQKSQFDLREAKGKFIAQAQRDTSANPSDANITAYKEDLMANPFFTDTEKTQMAAGADRILAMPVEQRKAFMASQGASAGELKPTLTPTKVAEYNFAKTPEGGGYTGSYQQFIQQQAAAGRAPAQPRAEQPPVAVVDPVTGKPVYVSRERAIGEKMSPATAQESLTPKEIQKREAVYPQATSAVKGFETKSEGFIKDLIALRDHPGLGSITGIAAGRMPGITGAGRAAQALFDKAVAKGGFQALQDMRDASKTGGALGSVSNQEGKQLTASFAAINRTQDAKDVRAAIDQAIGDLQGAKVRTREAYDLTYGYKQGSPAGGAGGAGVDTSNPLLR